MTHLTHYSLEKRGRGSFYELRPLIYTALCNRVPRCYDEANCRWEKLMSQCLTAVYRDGVFVVREPCDLPQDSQVQLIVQGPFLVPPAVTDPAERIRMLSAVTERMRQNPLPPDAPRFSRDDLHERR